MGYTIAEYTAEKLEQIQADRAYIKLNNLYLQIERGDITLNRHQYNQLNDLLCQAYDRAKEETMFNWWLHEFENLPNWLNV